MYNFCVSQWAGTVTHTIQHNILTIFSWDTVLWILTELLRSKSTPPQNILGLSFLTYIDMLYSDFFKFLLEDYNIYYVMFLAFFYHMTYNFNTFLNILYCNIFHKRFGHTVTFISYSFHWNITFSHEKTLRYYVFLFFMKYFMICSSTFLTCCTMTFPSTMAFFSLSYRFIFLKLVNMLDYDSYIWFIYFHGIFWAPQWHLALHHAESILWHTHSKSNRSIIRNEWI